MWCLDAMYQNCACQTAPGLCNTPKICPFLMYTSAKEGTVSLPKTKVVRADWHGSRARVVVYPVSRYMLQVLIRRQIQEREIMAFVELSPAASRAGAIRQVKDISRRQVRCRVRHNMYRTRVVFPPPRRGPDNHLSNRVRCHHQKPT